MFRNLHYEWRATHYKNAILRLDFFPAVAGCPPMHNTLVLQFTLTLHKQHGNDH